MDQGTSTVLAGLISAVAVIGGARSLEGFKLRQERRGVARALAGAIEFELWAIKRRGHLQFFRDKLEQIEAGADITFPDYP